MYSLSVLAKMRGWKFEYYVSHIAAYLKDNPHGNYKASLDNGMKIHIDKTLPIVTKEILLVEEGGRQKEAQFGLNILAKEILTWQKEHHIEALNIFLPSGTGSTALFLQKALVQKEMFDTKVFTCPCVGDSAYLKLQFLGLESDQRYHPTIITLEKKHHFGKLYKENYKIWLKLQEETGIQFDLLYDALGWRTLLAHPEVYSKPILYLHQGGLLGNDSMLPRYERKYTQDIK